MRQIYIPNKETYQMYRSFFNQSGAGYNPGDYIYSSHQVGAGLGGILRSVMKLTMPIGKKLIRASTLLFLPMESNSFVPSLKKS